MQPEPITCPRCDEPLYPDLARRTDEGWMHVTCRPGWQIRRKAREFNTARREDVHFLAETGENTHGAAARLGINRDALESWCRRNGLNAEWEQLRRRDPWNHRKGDAA